MDSSEDAWETTDVIICGCGPTGAMLSAYLGKLSIYNVVLEREAEIASDPRGIALDEDGIRLVQGLGLYPHLFTEVGSCVNELRFISGYKTDLHTEPFMMIDFGTTEGGTGHVGMLCHKQPFLERYLREAMSATAFSSLRLSSSVAEVSEDQDWVYCRYLDQSTGKTKGVRAKFLVGADGKTGFVRKQYLEPQGVKMVNIPGPVYDETWVALNWHMHLPTPATHPDFPLWSKGYSPQDVYDAFFPKNFRFLCNPSRAAVCGRFGLPSDRLWRFEFVVHESDGENGADMSSSSMVDKIVRPYLRHPGSRYGLDCDVEYPRDCIQVLRCRPFKFQARTCNQWVKGRVMLCGDAAHVFPPFGGQGIASGFRDAISLAWRLRIACHLDYTKNERQIRQLLEAWYLERSQQLIRSMKATVDNGTKVTTRSPFKAFVRDWFLWFAQLSPSFRHQLSLGPRIEGMVRYDHAEGLPFAPELLGGVCLPQVYCRQFLRGHRGGRDGGFGPCCFTDDVIWSDKKSGLFRFVILLRSIKDLGPTLDDIKPLLLPSTDGDKGFLTAANATILIEDINTDHLDTESNEYDIAHGWDLYRLASSEEFAASELCKGRPPPKGYDHTWLSREVRGARFLLLRPDRFVFAACNTADEVAQANIQVARYVDGAFLPETAV